MTNKVTTLNQELNDWITKRVSLSTLKFITCGSVDDGKSTLIGRILFEAQKVLDDQLASLVIESKRYGTCGDEIDLSLLVDGLAAEREQGITIDVAYRFFSTQKRSFIIADTPGHEQYTRNMVTAASNAHLAIILIDASKGMVIQTKRHAQICSLLGIKNVVVAINKMDLFDYSEEIYRKISSDFLKFVSELKFQNLLSIPICALKGENILLKSAKMPWYSGPDLISHLETIDIQKNQRKQSFVMPIQLVNKTTNSNRNYCGNLASGKISLGDTVRVVQSNEVAKVKNLTLHKKKIRFAQSGQAVSLTLDREIDVSRGDIITDIKNECKIADQFQAYIIWMDKDPGYKGRSYWLKLAVNTEGVEITKIKYKIDIGTSKRLIAQELQMNDLAVIDIKTDRPIPFDKYHKNKTMGGFILIDKLNRRTVASGMIKFSLRRSHNLTKQGFEVNKSSRWKLNKHKSFALWFTGISGAGKSTIANALEKKLHSKGIRTYLLDGDNVRLGLNKDLSFSEPDRIENIRRVAEVSKLMVDAGIVVLVALISPFAKERKSVKSLFEENEFFEIYVDTPIDVAEKRDPKGLYKKARAGNIKNFTGISSIYQKPKNPDITLDTVSNDVDASVNQILDKISLNL